MSKKILVETSARHVHLSQADLEILFGKGEKLHYIKELSQPGQYACEERVEVVGPKRSIPRVSVLGPTRAQSQVELSMTDARALGVAAPIRESGVLGGSAGVKLVGPAGEVELAEGLIVAMRHIHTTPQDAAQMGVCDKDVVDVRVESEHRSLVFGDVVVRVNPSYATAMHIDTDEANAAGASGEVYGKIVK